MKNRLGKHKKPFLTWFRTLWALLFASGFGLICVTLWLVPAKQVEHIQRLLPEEEKLNIKEETDLVNEYRSDVVQGIGTFATIFGGLVLYLNYRNASKKLAEDFQKNAHDRKINEARLSAERFSKAIEQIGTAEGLHIRLGGIYSLEKFLEDSPDDYWTVIEVLSAFIREETPNYTDKYMRQYNAAIRGELEEFNYTSDKSNYDPSAPKEECKPEVQAALTVICRSKNKNKEAETAAYRDNIINSGPVQEQRGIDLSRIKLSGAKLSGEGLQAADLSLSNLTDCDLFGASLVNANLRDTFLCRADLSLAEMQGAELCNATMLYAKLESTNLQGADLSGADLDYAKLVSATLIGANLTGADLTNAVIAGVDLTEANLSESNLTGAELWSTNLHKANLTGADFRDVKFDNTHLTEADLNGAKNLTDEQLAHCILCKTKLPEGLESEPDRDCKEIERRRSFRPSPKQS